MIIIVEGADGLGKTTLCRALSDALDYPIYKPVATPLRGQSVVESQAEDRGAWGVTLALDDPDIIFDRAFPSEYAYGRAFERDFDERQVAKLDHLVALRPHVAFHIVSNIWDSSRVSDMGPGEWYRVAEAYADYRHWSRLRWVSLPRFPDPREALRAVSVAA